MDYAQAQALVEAYADLVTRIGYTWFNNPYDAQDICQTVFLKLLTHEIPADPQGARRWVIRIAVNECKNLRRSAWFRRTTALDDGLPLAVELPEPEDSPVLSAVQKLPLKYREAIFLHYYEGYSVTEIAEMLGQRPALVSTHLCRARVKLKAMLGGEPHEQTI